MGEEWVRGARGLRAAHEKCLVWSRCSQHVRTLEWTQGHFVDMRKFLRESGYQISLPELKMGGQCSCDGLLNAGRVDKPRLNAQGEVGSELSAKGHVCVARNTRTYGVTNREAARR